MPLPKPQFFVFYNGRKKEAERRELRLSDAFGGYTCLEAVVQMYNLNAGMNEEFILGDASLNNYCTFLNLYHKFLSEGADENHALKATLDYCISHGIMVGYLEKIKKELASMLALEYDPELERQAWIEQGLEQGLKQGLKQGLEQGIEQKAVAIAKNLLKMNFSTDDIVKITGCTREQILKLADE